MQSAKKSKPSLDGLFCNYQHRTCMQNRLEGHLYCIRHILEDKTAPFKQCNYVYPRNGKRCGNATHKSDKKDGLCQEHAKKHALLQQKILVRKRKIVETPETLLDDLDQGLSEETRNAVDVAVSHLDDFHTDSESDRASPVIDRVWHGDGDSDAESDDSEQEDPLKHAGVYTAEEVALIIRDKLIRLQSLYIEQFKRLKHVLKEKRRKYIHDLKQEKETIGSIHDMPRRTVEEIGQYERLKALHRYHRRHGPELLLHNQAKERRFAATDGANSKIPHNVRCIHTSDGERCGERVLPLSKYCLTHILYDPHQVLFRPCHSPSASCTQPIIPAVDGPNCSMHVVVPSFPPIHNKSDETEDAHTKERLSSRSNRGENKTLMPAGFYPDMSDVDLQPENLSLFPPEFLVSQQASPETDVDK